MPTVTAQSKFVAAQRLATADGHVDKQEARALRKLALADCKASVDKERTAARYGDTFRKLEGAAVDPKAKRYLATVGDEFAERGTYEAASKALRRYLEGHAGKLPPALANIDTAAGFEVGTSMNRGLWLRVELKDRGQYFESTEAARQLFTRVPALERFGSVYVIS